MSAKYQDDELIIRPAKKEDMTAVAEMIQELADFEKMPDGPKLKVKDLERDGFELSPPVFNCLIAEERGGATGATGPSGPRAIGYALYFPIYSTWQGRATQLEDLYVRRGARRRGAGGRLFDAVAKEAAAHGSRLDFHVLSWNPARGFYDARGAANLTEAESWCYYRLAGQALTDLATKNSS